MESRSFGEVNSECQPSMTPQKGKVDKRLFEEGTSKEESNKERGRDQPPMLLAQHWFCYPGEQMEGTSGTPETLGWHYKRGSSQQ